MAGKELRCIRRCTVVKCDKTYRKRIRSLSGPLDIGHCKDSLFVGFYQNSYQKLCSNLCEMKWSLFTEMVVVYCLTNVLLTSFSLLLQLSSMIFGEITP